MKDFTELSQFAAHLTMLIPKALIAAHHGLEHASQVVEKAAKEEFGNYQVEAGPFLAWDDLKDSTKADRVRKGWPEDEPLLRSGALRDSITHEVHGLEAVVGSDSEVMVYQELGTTKMAPRAVLGPAAIRTEKIVGRILGNAVGRAIAGRNAITYGDVNGFTQIPE